MMLTAYPSELEDRIVLSNDRPVHIRPLRRFDDRPVRELFGRLSPRTWFVAYTLWDNLALRKLLRHVGVVVSSRVRHGVAQIGFVPRV